LPPDREPLTPLPENGARFSYGELLSRLHGQATAAMDAFFVDAWTELEQASTGLEQTARFLPKSESPPAHVQDRLIDYCNNLQKDATRLGSAARTKNAEAATEALQRITLQIRQLKATKE
jgi:hypothetical protein